MPLGPIELGGRRALVLGFDPEAAGLPALVSGSVVVVTPDGRVSRDLRERLAPDVRGVSFSEAQADPDSVAVVHTLWSARVLPVLSTVRAGVRTFHLVDTPGSSYKSNARGALIWAVKRALARLFVRLPLVGRWAELAVGHRLDVPWPSATATLRMLDSPPGVPSSATRENPPRVVHWLPELGPCVDDVVALIEHLVPATLARGAGVEVVIPGYPQPHDVRIRRLERLGATCRFISRRPWKLWSDRPRLDGLAAGLVRDLERHVHTDVFFPFLEDLLERTPRPAVIHAWLEPTLASTSVVGVAGKLLGSRLMFHLAGTPAAAEELAVLCLGRLARDTDAAVLAPDPRTARALAALSGIASDRIAVVPPVVTSEPTLSGSERASRRRLLDVAEGALLLVAVGPLEREATPFLLEVTRRIQGAGIDVRVFHLGLAGVEAHLCAREANLQSRLRLLGVAPDEREYLRVADVVLCLAEPTIRTWAQGTPIVAPAGDDEGVDAPPGLAYPRGDAPAAADQILRLAREAELRRSLSERALSLAAERAAPERFVATVLGHYPPSAVTPPGP